MLPRRKTRTVSVGRILIGSDYPIPVQSMTNTLTEDAESTLRQVKALEAAGADIVRISVPNAEAAAAFGKIVKQAGVPLISDIHYDYKMALLTADAGAGCLRINPGNIGSAAGVKEVVKAAKANHCSIRIGVNGGSLERGLLEKYGEPCAQAMVESALTQAQMLEDLDFHNIKISVKASDTMMTIQAYELLAQQSDYPLHLGVTEAGGLMDGTIKSAMAFGHLLYKGIGDTIRVSLTADPVEEIKAGKKILKAFKLSNKGINIVSCPTCSRRCIDVIGLVEALEKKYENEQRNITLAVMGCTVNRLEALHADFGVYGLDKNNNTCKLCVKGEEVAILNQAEVLDRFDSLFNASL